MRTGLVQDLLRSRDRGQATAWFVGGVLALVLLFGLVGDGGVLFAAHRRASLLAESGARAGASVVDAPAFRADTAGPPVLDTAAAADAARAYVRRQQPDAHVDAEATPDLLTVQVHLRIATTILHPAGEPEVEIVAEGQARPFIGQDTPSE